MGLAGLTPMDGPVPYGYGEEDPCLYGPGLFCAAMGGGKAGIICDAGVMGEYRTLLYQRRLVFACKPVAATYVPVQLICIYRTYVVAMLDLQNVCCVGIVRMLAFPMGVRVYSGLGG